MKVILITGSIVLPLIMFFSQKTWIRLRLIYNLVTIIALLVFGNIASLAVYQVIKDKTVFMTAIHAIFLNPLFLISGAYIGIYVLYRILLVSIEEQQK